MRTTDELRRYVADTPIGKGDCVCSACRALRHVPALLDELDALRAPAEAPPVGDELAAFLRRILGRQKGCICSDCLEEASYMFEREYERHGWDDYSTLLGALSASPPAGGREEMDELGAELDAALGDDTARLTKDDALSATLRFLNDREPFGLLGLKKMVRKALAIGEKGADHEHGD